MFSAIAAGLGLASNLLGGGSGGGGGGGAPQAPQTGLHPGQMMALANLQQYIQGPYRQQLYAGQGLQGGGVQQALSELPMGNVQPYPFVPMVQAGMGGYSGQGLQPGSGGPGLRAPQNHNTGSIYDLSTGPVGGPGPGLLDDPSPNMADRFRRLGGMVSEAPRNAPPQPPSAPAIGGGSGFDIRPFIRRGVRPMR